MFGTKTMLKNSTLTNLKLDNKDIDEVKHFNYLGVYLDNSVTMEIHKKEYSRSANHKLHLFSKLRFYLNNRQAINIYETKILPYLEYSNILYDKTNKDSLNKMQRLQNKVLRTSLRLPPGTSTLELHQLAKINTLEDRREIALLCHAFRHKNDPKFLAASRTRTRLHDAPVLLLLRPKTKVMEVSVLNKSATLWNALNHTTRNMQTLDKFKDSIKKTYLAKIM